jgi:hypothetical protein
VEENGGWLAKEVCECDGGNPGDGAPENEGDVTKLPDGGAPVASAGVDREPLWAKMAAGLVIDRTRAEWASFSKSNRSFSSSSSFC